MISDIAASDLDEGRASQTRRSSTTQRAEESA
jgi:hypothetical protein